jgi:hypothetical protein
MGINRHNREEFHNLVGMLEQQRAQKASHR